MKTLDVNGRTLQYEVCFYNSEFGCDEYTEFFEGTKSRTFRKYLLFGPKITKLVPNKVFELSINIEDPCFTKQEIRSRIEKQIELLERTEQIQRGEII